MKKTITLFCISIIAYTCNAQKIKESEVPQEVKTIFTKMFPNTKVHKWEVEEKNYEAEFDFNKVETSALFEANGTHLQTEYEIDISMLPKDAKEYILKNTKEKKIKEASIIDFANGKKNYEAEIDGMDYMFDDNGIFIKKIPVEKDADEDKE